MIETRYKICTRILFSNKDVSNMAMRIRLRADDDRSSLLSMHDESTHHFIAFKQHDASTFITSGEIISCGVKFDRRYNVG